MRIADQWRITTFRLTVVFGAFFTVAVVVLLGFIYWQTQSYLTGQVDTVLQGMEADFSGMDRAALPVQIQHSILYDARHIVLIGLFSSAGAPLAGNLRYIPPALQADERLHEFSYDASLRYRSRGAGVAILGAWTISRDSCGPGAPGSTRPRPASPPTAAAGWTGCAATRSRTCPG